MLNNELIKKIESFVYKQPRSIDEIAKLINKNWRTADRHISEIEKEYGTLSVKVFRAGSRGALKIVFWNSQEKVSNTIFQEHLEKEIIIGRKKEDFSAFDIFQYVDPKNKSSYIKYSEREDVSNLEEFSSVLKNTKKQLLVFSGNLSFINLKNKNINMFDEVETLVKNNVSIKILCRIDFASIENIEKILSLNFKYGKDIIEIHHKEQPLRGLISDNKLITLKEVKEPTGKTNELNKRMFIFYTILDKSWCEWLNRIFWRMFSSSIDAHKRLEELQGMKRLSELI